MVSSPEVRYCYECGQRVKTETSTRCWYCGAPTDRILIEQVRCPFCDEVVSARAVKCPHCREFLDGRPSPQVGGALHITYVVDKAVIQANSPVRLQGGRPVPPDLRARLSPATVDAIESNDPRRIDQQGVRALPAPEGRVDKQGPPEARVPVPLPAGPVPQRHDAAPIAPSDATPREQDAPVQEPPVDSEPRYRACNFCRTDCLASDNFCFHCGAVLRPDAVAGRYRPKRKRTNVGLLTASLVLMCAMLGIAAKGGTFPTDSPSTNLLAYLGVSALAPILLLVAFFRVRRTLNQALAIVVGALWFATLVLGGMRMIGGLEGVRDLPESPADRTQAP